MTPAPESNSRQSALEKCDELFAHFDLRAKRHKKNFSRYKYASVALTVAVTVIAALQGIYSPAPWWAWVLPVVSGLAAFCTTMVHATNAQELWLRARTMTQRLDAERFLFLQGAGAYSEQDENRSVNFFSDRLMEIWEGGHEEWTKAIEHQKGA